MKTNISKAYDMIDWSYFSGVMTKMGFLINELNEL